ncbi:cysteine desulfurase family protein [Pseudomonas kitaguniensis]|uniref:cysteine desulfurase family protein n=1 Tax=Pseudomonas kitaguniensis TaxID=2607908 RepID=UPI003BA0DF4C
MKTIYLDFAATTRCENEVIDGMQPYYTDDYGNSSSPHVMGRIAHHAVNSSRDKIANLLHADPSDILFTSGATESNNIVVLGAFAYGETAPSNAVFLPIDHKSIIEAARELARRGVEVRYVKYDTNGRICRHSLEAAIDINTKLLSVCHVNSEIGIIQDLEMLTEIIASRDLIFHLDIVQSLGKIQFDLRKSRIDCASFSAHKIGGPKGVGGLYLNQKTRAKLRPLFFGGELNSLRSGTTPTPLAVGFGIACELRAKANLLSEWTRVDTLKALFLSALRAYGVKFELNTHSEHILPHILNVRFHTARSETLISALKEVCIASGSACNSSNLQASYVLRGIGLSDEQANCSIRVSISPTLKEHEIKAAAEMIAAEVLKL